ncbi:WG repeat-containing protein [Psychroserpens sp.]|uniref:WG repeat-containing protein n=1 Tax=Psychroserpens sp. TaxID=2020870 RepID=UPI001B1BBC27|nr:WG repeat-containing protein [Psychroserpens sp.]MBO6607497.1 WG repeat-containing protein [Psychroserpens sp.]MBO6632510.1 WG repeat-containing protein [Psychroserpens sp.]MBO6654425.1 WG repeat-containing protein [Psychroserpens sp.]MBO6681226.1 WG repeat-containing protein [Psychroserpens sp.]MBO6749817.1 WG repeat-containing protein [Psychroserpens sp.]
MKTIRTFIFCVFFIPILGIAQPIENLEFISPFKDGVAAVKSNDTWGFINEKGQLIIDFRRDLVATTFEDGQYPAFMNERCLIEMNKEGISYYGYINKSGEVIVEPQYLNATNYDNGLAIVLELIKVKVGENTALGKTIAYDKYLEAIINVDGNIVQYVSPKRVNVILDKDYLKGPPKIKSKRISDYLYAYLNEDRTWTVVAIQ